MTLATLTARDAPPRTAERADAAAWPWRLALGAIIVALTLPLFTTDQPPLLDYPNHLARMYILTHAGDPILSQIYAVHWQLVPNLGMDLVVPWLARIMPLDVAGRCFIAAALLLPFLGAVALHRAVFGRRSWWPFATALIAYNGLLLAGFLNFMVAIGLALLGAALWVRQAETPLPRLVCASLFAVATFVCHLFGCAFFGLLLLGFELGGRGPASADIVVKRIAALALPFLPVAILFLWGGFLDRSDGAASPMAILGQVIGHLIHFDLRAKLSNLFVPFGGYSPMLDRLSESVAVLLLAWGVWRGRLVPARWLLGVAATLALLYPLVPTQLIATMWIDIRLVLLAAFAVIPAVAPLAPTRREAAFAIAGTGALLAARITFVTLAWCAHNNDLAALRSLLAPLEPGARVLGVVADDETLANAQREPAAWHFFGPQPAFWHMAAPAIIEHGGFWPFLFAAPTKQPLRVLPPYDVAEDYGPTGAPAPAWLLRRAIEDPTAPHQTHALDDWPARYDYVLLLAAKRLAQPATLDPAHLTLVGTSDIAALYRVRKP